jgi:predicted nucleotidyltransferase
MADELSATVYDALKDVVALLDALPQPNMLIGAIAVIANGYARTTDDIDATISGAVVSPEQVLECAAEHGIHPRIADAAAFAKRTQVLLLIHSRSGTKVDVSLASVPFEEEALARQRGMEFRGMQLRICDPEDLILYKVVAARPQDLEDARQLLMRHDARIDRGRIRSVLATFDQILDDGRSRVGIWQEVERAAFPRR